MSSSSRSTFVQNDKYMQTDEGSDDFSVSARKLAATLWETKLKDLEEKSQVEMGWKERVSKLGSAPLQFSHPFNAPVSERMERSKVSSHRRRKLTKPDLSHQNGCSMEVDRTQNHGETLSRHHLKDVCHGLTTCKELLQVLSHVWNIKEHKSTCSSLFSAINTELDWLCDEVSKLINEHRHDDSEVDILLKKFEEEKMAWKTKEQDKIHTAIMSVDREFKIEKKLRKQTERLNKKLGRELADTKASLSKVVKELEGEKRDREILEQVCDNLARGLGEDRAEMQELKRQSAKIRKEVEMEQKMLQLADVMREERVQMKLSEAKYQFEEKNAAVDKLRNGLEAYFRSKKGQEKGGDSPNHGTINELERHLKETLPSTHHYRDNKNADGEILNKGEDGEESDSADSDLHSIELNIGDNSKSHQWCTALQNDLNRLLVSDKNTGRSSTSEKFPVQRISLEREASDGIEWEFRVGEKENMNTMDRGISNFLNIGGTPDFSSQTWKKDHSDETERYKMIKDLCDRIISASRIASSQGFSGPTKNFSQQKLSATDPNKVMVRALPSCREKLEGIPEIIDLSCRELLE
ncbi:putative leucine-rich repeat-containing protein 48-like [Capsicum annuum]|nr:putative leucine-rich repeat-containing protein 48-like [Capsicum annuum]